MAYQSFNPSGLPYVTTALAPFGDTSGAIPADFTGTGNLADGADTTSVTVHSTPTNIKSAVVAVDFAAIPNLVIPSGDYPLFGMSMRVTLTGAGSGGTLVPMGLFSLGGTQFVSLLAPFPTTSDTTSPQTFVTDDAYFTLFDGATAIRDFGFTLAFGLDSSSTPSGPIDLATFEVSLRFDTDTACITTLIPFGSSDDLTIPAGPDSTDFYVGGTSFGDGSDYTDLIAANTTDATGVLSSDDTTTYATIDAAGFNADMIARYGTGSSAGYLVSIKARQDPSVTIPVGMTLTAVNVVAVFRSTSSVAPFTASWASYTDTYPEGGLVAPSTLTLGTSSGDWVRGSASVDPAFLAIYPTFLRDALANRAASIRIQHQDYTSVDDVAFIGLEITYCPTATTTTFRRRSSIRQLQRGGPGGLGGIPRGSGMATARGSLRRGPGTVY